MKFEHHPPPTEPPVVSLDAYRVQRFKDFCPHNEREINQNRRSVKCTKCGADLDVFDCLFRLCADREQLVWKRNELQREVKELGEKRDRLKADVANAKEQLRRAQARAT